MNDFDEKDLDPMTEDHSAPDTDPIDDGADEAMSSLGETTVLDPAVDETAENPALDADERDEVETDEAPKRPRKALAIAAGLALVAVLGIGGAWVTGAFSGGEAPEAVKDAATSVQAAVRGEAKVSISAKADGWTEELPAFGYAVVDEEGKTADEGELTPGKALSLTLPDGVYAVSITSIPTKADGVGTWAPPASQMLQVVDGESTPSEISFTLLPVDPADAEAVEAVTANLPEAEREAAKQLLAAKKEDPKADRVEIAPVKPQPAPSKPEAGKPSKKWGVVKKAWDEKVLVSAAWDETVVVKPAWTENKLVKDAWTETINHPAEYRYDMVETGRLIYHCNGCSFTTTDATQREIHSSDTGHSYWTEKERVEKPILVKDAWTETINHPAQHQTVNHPAETKTVHHDAVYKTVHHDAVYGWI